MSVINQMLKDLDKRQNEQQGGSSIALAVPKKTSITTWLVTIVAIIIILNVVGLLGWQLYSENQQLRAQVEKELVASHGKQKNVREPKANATPNVTSAVKQALILTTEAAAKSPPVTNNIDAVTTLPTSITKTASFQDKDTELNHLEATVDSENTVSKENAKHQAESTATTVATAKHSTTPEQVDEPAQTKASLTISRSQLSPQALAANKITQAEQAIERNDLSKAESLFEEVLLIIPEHETARKQLAALWYGKKSYQDAVNLLSQGIALAPPAEEMRLMAARIYYERGQPRQTFNILSPIKQSVRVETQALFANVAAELNEHEHAIIAYRKLIALEPNLGRWWLGSAVSLDSLGKFVLAREAYKQAIALNNLSNSAMQFARQRLIELGE